MEQKNFYSHIPYRRNVPYLFFGTVSVHFALFPNFDCKIAHVNVALMIVSLPFKPHCCAKGIYY